MTGEGKRLIDACAKRNWEGMIKRDICYSSKAEVLFSIRIASGDSAEKSFSENQKKIFRTQMLYIARSELG